MKRKLSHRNNSQDIHIKYNLPRNDNRLNLAQTHTSNFRSVNYSKRYLSLPKNYNKNKNNSRTANFFNAKKKDLGELFKSGFDSFGNKITEISNPSGLQKKLMNSNWKWRKFLLGDGIPNHQMKNYSRKAVPHVSQQLQRHKKFRKKR